jgi:hypothetical protein
MADPVDFRARLEFKVTEQLHAQRVAYLLGAGTSYLDGDGYPLAGQLWDLIKACIKDATQREEIQAKLDGGATDLEHALDQLDNSSITSATHRLSVVDAIAELFESLKPPLGVHVDLLKRLSQKANPLLKLFTLNYDPLPERAAEQAGIRLYDGYAGHEHAYFDPEMFEERIGRIRGTYKARQFDETTKPIHLIKLHGSLGWYECPLRGIRRCTFSSPVPASTKRLMIPPHNRKANDTMMPPYSILWSAFRGALGQDAIPINRLACIGYGFLDEHVNAVIEAALGRTNFSLLIFARTLTNPAWSRWSPKTNTIVVTEARCSLKSEVGPGHPDLWRFERIAKEV